MKKTILDIFMVVPILMFWLIPIILSIQFLLMKYILKVKWLKIFIKLDKDDLYNEYIISIKFH